MYKNENFLSFRYTIGLREGATEECDSKLQAGFSRGFHTSFNTIVELGKLRGRLCSLQTLYQGFVNDEELGRLLNELSNAEQSLKVDMDCDIERSSRKDFQPSELLQDYSKLISTITNFITSTIFVYKSQKNKTM